jgi:hypothetical protein
MAMEKILGEMLPSEAVKAGELLQPALLSFDGLGGDE